MRFLAGLAALAFTCSIAAAHADAPPLRHLVYVFTYESRQQGAAPHAPGSAPDSRYNPNLDDQGTITVDVQREAPDRGLVVLVSEQGKYRSASMTTCAVYGDTAVACDQGKAMNAEEYTVLRFLGPNFFDPTRLDSNQHWSISQRKSGTTVKADYTVTKAENGTMKIDETRQVTDTSQGPIVVEMQTKIDYNANRLLPTAIEEGATEYQHVDVVGVTSITYQMTFKLVSDSMGTP
jgi:hypothetical protein